ncbi:MAG TPA: hypothetical protein VK872_10795 [Draconibacterium sp.]|jgi:hypothetical protein|nr:hypothetical protein [Draconibacterium sp.]
MALKFSELNPLVKAQTEGAQRITSWLAMLALIVLAAEIIIILALFVTPKTSAIYNWFVPIILVFLLVFVVAYFYERKLAAKQPSNESLAHRKIEKQVKGCWFEFVHNHNNIAFSVCEIGYDESQMQFLLNGTGYTKDGKKVASWKSSGCAVTNLTVPEFKYFWEGEHFTGAGSDKTFSGIGVVKFPYISSGAIAKAEGWYISGSISELNFTGRYKMDFVKCTKDEIGKIAENDSKWLNDRYQKWKNSFAND